MRPSWEVRPHLGPSPFAIRLRKLITIDVHVGMESGRGAFAEYAKAYSDVVWKVPEGTYSFEEVAATGIP